MGRWSGVAVAVLAAVGTGAAACPTPQQVAQSAVDVLVSGKLSECKALNEALTEVGKACGGKLDVVCLSKQLIMHREELVDAAHDCQDKICGVKSFHDVMHSFETCDKTLEAYAKDAVDDACKVVESEDCSLAKDTLKRACSESSEIKAACSFKVSTIFKLAKLGCDVGMVEPSKGLRAAALPLEAPLWPHPRRNKTCPGIEELSASALALLASRATRQCKELVQSFRDSAAQCPNWGPACLADVVMSYSGEWLLESKDCVHDVCASKVVQREVKRFLECRETVHDYVSRIVRELCAGKECSLPTHIIDDVCGASGMQQVCNTPVGDLASRFPDTCKALTAFLDSIDPVAQASLLQALD